MKEFQCSRIWVPCFAPKAKHADVTRLPHGRLPSVAGRGTHRRSALVAALLGIVALAAGCSQQRISYSRSDDTDSAFEAGANQPPTARTLYSMARVFISQGRDAEGESVLKTVLESFPDFMPAYSTLAELHLRHGRMPEAMSSLSAGLARAPNDPILLNNLGMCWLMSGDYQRALTSFSSASAAVPADARSRANMAVALGMLGRYDESLKLYQQVVPPAQAHYNLAVLCKARKDLDRAEQERKLASDLDPSIVRD